MNFWKIINYLCQIFREESLVCFLWLGRELRWERDFFCCPQCIFSLVCSHQVPKVFLKIFHNSTTLLSHMVCWKEWWANQSGPLTHTQKIIIIWVHPQLRNRISTQRTRQCSIRQGRLMGFSFSFWVGWEVEGWILLVLQCSQSVLIKFPRSSMKFPMASHFHCICLPNSCLLFTNTSGSKGEALYLVIETSILRSFPRFNYFLWWAKKKKTKLNLGGRDNLINTKMNNYLKNKRGILNDLNLCYIIADACCFLNQKKWIFFFASFNLTNFL
jgi:hypothetical protein